MLLAGFQTQSSGEIYFRGRPLSKVAPHQRNFGVVFQSYALFPHMSVAENILFPLKMRGMARDKAEGKLNRALDMIRMKAFALRKPAELSGGQQQRVALARALVFDPDLLLLDEPLAALDKSLREELQYELRSLHEQLGVTMLYVTHDQGEALTLSDRMPFSATVRSNSWQRQQNSITSPRQALSPASSATPISSGDGGGGVWQRRYCPDSRRKRTAHGAGGRPRGRRPVRACDTAGEDLPAAKWGYRLPPACSGQGPHLPRQCA
jgi:ABC-type sugar transport system ATPase subunit